MPFDSPPVMGCGSLEESVGGRTVARVFTALPKASAFGFITPVTPRKATDLRIESMEERYALPRPNGQIRTAPTPKKGSLAALIPLPGS
jgi:hypothetical protein